MNNNNWFNLGVRLFANDHYNEAFDAFQHSLNSSFIGEFASLTWMGHIRDLQNKREEAISYYKDALLKYPGFHAQHDQWNIVINDSWIEKRICKPFKGIK